MRERRTPVTTVIVAGPRLLRQSLAALLERQAGVAVVGVCATDEAAVMAGDLSPDVAVVEMPPHDRPPRSYLLPLARLRPAPRVILVTRDPSRDEVAAAVELGVDACVAEEDGCEHLLAALDAVRDAERFVGPSTAAHLRQQSEAARPGVEAHTAIPAALTPREREILALIVHGNSGPQIARRLGVSPRTVHAHRTSVMSKLGVHNSIALVRRAVTLGLAEL